MISRITVGTLSNLASDDIIGTSHAIAITTSTGRKEISKVIFKSIDNKFVYILSDDNLPKINKLIGYQSK